MQLYHTLQDDAVVVIRDLSSYADLQVSIVGGLVKTAGKSENSFQTYLNINKAHILNFVESSAEMWKRYHHYKTQWELAVTNVQKLINEERSVCSTFLRRRGFKTFFRSLMSVDQGYTQKQHHPGWKEQEFYLQGCDEDYWRHC